MSAGACIEYRESIPHGAPVEPAWYALHTRSNFEKRIAADLAAKGVEVFLPAYEELHRWKDRQKTVSVPLFPGYVFARFPGRPDWRVRVVQTSGVVGILGQNGNIECIPEPQIEAVRALLNCGVPLLPHPFLREGDWIRIRRGALRGTEGILVRTKNGARVVVSVMLLSRSVAAEIDARDIEPAAARWRM